jgi:hypothetical protein
LSTGRVQGRKGVAVGGTSRTLYLRFEDSFPEDGWGAWLSHLRLDLER